jgi:hypothetical protein
MPDPLQSTGNINIPPPLPQIALSEEEADKEGLEEGSEEEDHELQDRQSTMVEHTFTCQ